MKHNIDSAETALKKVSGFPTVPKISWTLIYKR